MIIDPSGTLSRASAIGFGYSMNNIIISGNTLNTAGALESVAFTMPRDGTINAIAANFTNVLGTVIANLALTIRCSLFSAPPTSNTFTEIPAAFVDLAPTLTGAVTLGQSFSGIKTGLSIPVTEGTRLMLVFRLILASGTLTSAIAITGTSSAGITV